eukprot:COSAG02_NODE_13274_length_1417_cov_1.501517_1_plen_310_part_00
MGGNVESWIDSASSASSSAAAPERPRDASTAASGGTHTTARVSALPEPAAISTPTASLRFGHMTPVSASSSMHARTVMASGAGRSSLGSQAGPSVDAHRVRLRLKVEQLSQQLQAVERRNQAMQRQLERGTAREVKLQQQKDEEARRHAAHMAQLEQAQAETDRLAKEERESVAEERDELAAMVADVEEENAELQRQNEILQQQNAALQDALDAKTAKCAADNQALQDTLDATTAESAAANQAARAAGEAAEAKLAVSSADVERGLAEIARLRTQVAALQQANGELNTSLEQITRVASKIAGAISTGAV